MKNRALLSFVAVGLVAAASSACGAGEGGGGAGGAATGGSGQGGCSTQATGCAVAFHYPLGSEKSVELRGDFAPDGWDVGIPLQIDMGEWRTTLDAPNGSTIHYKYLIDGETWVTDPTNPLTQDDGFGAKNSVVMVSCDERPSCPTTGDGGSGGGPPIVGEFDWRSAVLYFVFVDRFKNGDPSNDDPVADVETPANYQGGDYAGLLEQIEAGYFDDLGVNALWLTVPMDNPSVAGPGADGHQYSAYHGYWPQNLEDVEEHFGDLALLKQVVDAAHAHGIKVLFDYAMNHVHISSPLFTDHPDWFWPLDFDGRYCVCGAGCSWDGYEGRRCWFRDYLPDWNFQNPEARAASLDNALYWIKETGVDGYRLDAVKHIETVWIEDLRRRVNEEIDQSKTHFYMVGETFDTGNRDFIRQYVSPTLLDGQFDFPLRGAIVENLLRRSGTMYDLDNFLASNDSYYPGIMSTFIGNHDIARVIQTALDSPWGAWDNGGSSNWSGQPGAPPNRAPYERVALGFTFLFTTKGIPLVYYGDEIGMPGSGDPDNRRMMQWTGLSADQTFLLDRVKKLGSIRKDHPALWRGDRSTVFVSNDVYVYRMTDGGESIYVALNRSDTAQNAENLPASATDLLTDEVVTGPTTSLAPRSARILLP
ncbi:MAG: alpha-amylase family glycosyl hydrolase [Polyangiaceae bacterium]